MKLFNAMLITIAMAVLLATSPAVGQMRSPDQARATLKQVAGAYQQIPALTDTMQMDLQMGEGGQKSTITYRFDQNGVALHIDHFRFVAVDDAFYGESEDIDDKYLEMDLNEHFAATFLNITGGDSTIVPAPLFLRAMNDDDFDPGAFSHGALTEPSITGVTAVQHNGKRRTRIALEGSNGTANVFIDPNSKLIHEVKINISSQQMPDGANVTFTYDPQVHKELSEPIAFEPGEREKVTSMGQLQPTPRAKGDDAPDFDLQTIAGDQVAMRELSGNVVVLDFWATWCQPCKRGLPLLDKFHQWTESNDKPVRVFAVNTLERQGNREQIEKSVKSYWQREAFSVPTLMDYEQSLIRKYGYTRIPTTVIIGPDGKVEAVHSGFTPDMVDQLKKEVNRIIEKHG